MIKMEPVTSTKPDERLAYSVDEAAAITGLSRDLLYDQMRTGKLAYLKVGRHGCPARSPTMNLRSVLGSLLLSRAGRPVLAAVFGVGGLVAGGRR
jgi:excisionase family DNA binding protein